MRRLLAVLLLSILPGCSMAVVKSREQIPLERYAAECTATSLAPAADTALAVGGALLVLGGVGMAASDPVGSDHETGGFKTGVVAAATGLVAAILGGYSAYYGASETAACRAARAQGARPAVSFAP